MATVKNSFFVILWVFVIVTGIFLGRWQLDRLAWKEDLLSNIDFAYQHANFRYPPPDVFPEIFERMDMTIHFESDLFFIVRPRLRDGRVGGHLYQRGKLPDGMSVWTNRGFVPDGWSGVKDLPQKLEAVVQIRVPEFLGLAQFNGHEKPFTATMFTMPAGQVWPGVVAIVEPGARPDSPGVTPVGERPTPPNNHLHYAVFWFVMSGLAGMFGAGFGMRALLNYCRTRGQGGISGR